MSENGVDAPTDLEQKIIRQVEYYYGDINIIRDKFLQELIKEDDGWVSMETMLKFKRLAALSEDNNVIGAALKKSKAGLMEVNEDSTKIRRNPDKPIPDLTRDRAKSLKTRTIYAKGFPEDSELDPLIIFFDKFGKTEHVLMRKNKDKTFKGSCFVTYVDDEGAKKFLEGDSLKYGETELVRYTKDDYFKSKDDEKKKHKDNQAQKKEDDWKVKKEEEENQKDEEFKGSITRGAILDLKNIPEGSQREDLKDLLDEYSTVAWQDFVRGQTEAKIRFEDEGGAKLAWEKALEAGGGKVELKGQVLEGRVLEGEEEEQHWKLIREKQQQIRDRNRSQRGGRGRGRGGYRGRGGGRGGGRRSDRRGGDRSRSRDNNRDNEGNDDGSKDNTQKVSADSSDVKQEKSEVKREPDSTADGQPAAKVQKTVAGEKPSVKRDVDSTAGGEPAAKVLKTE